MLAIRRGLRSTTDRGAGRRRRCSNNSAPLAAFLYYLFTLEAIESISLRVSHQLAGVLYIGLLITFISLLEKRGPDGGAWVFITLTCTWFSDTLAYFAGRFLGPHLPAKLYPSVSPKKTVVGGVGGLAGSLLALVLAKLWYLPSLTWVISASRL